MKAWWLGFPRFRCPHCGQYIEGVKFAGHFKLPKAKKVPEPESKREEVRDP